MPQKLSQKKLARRQGREKPETKKRAKSVNEDLERVYPIFFDFAESDNELVLRTELPGVSDERHQLKVESHRVKIMALPSVGNGKSRTEGKNVKEVPQVLDLPMEVDPAVTTASLNCGLLELRMPRVMKDPGHEVFLKAS